MNGASPAQLTLVDGTEQIIIRPVPATGANPVFCRSYDYGAPDVREASSPLGGIDGNLDSTALTGPRTVTLDLVILGDDGESPYSYAERLEAMTHPTRRPYLYAGRYGATPDGDWRMLLRGNPYSISYGRRAAGLLELSLSFTAPIGYFESPLREFPTGLPGVTDTELKFPTHFPLTFGTTSSTPSVTVNIGGSVPVSPTILAYGPSVDPSFSTDSGDLFAFHGLTLVAGQFVAIDMAAGTVLLNGDINGSVFHLVDWSVSRFFRFYPNTTRQIRPGSTTGQLVVQWRDRRYGI